MIEKLKKVPMSGKFRICLMAAACGAVALSSAALAQSRLVSPPLEGYTIGYEASDGAQSIREEIPKGETVEKWSSMVTTQRFAGSDLSALQFAESMHKSISIACENSSMSEPTELKHQGFEAASYSATCFSTPPHGGPETLFLMAVRTPDALLVKQVAFRDTITTENMAWAVKVLRSSVVCDDGCPIPKE